jgi:beta-lactam-binding protein with PASTA domain
VTLTAGAAVGFDVRGLERRLLGKVTKAESKTVPKGKVISQSPRVGKKLARGAKVNLVLSRGKH